MSDENNLIIVDVNQDNQVILIDNTINHELSIKRHFFDRVKLVHNYDNTFVIECKTLANYKGIITRLNQYHFAFVETSNLQLLVANLQANSLNNRINKCQQIKQKNKQLFNDSDFLNFKQIVDNETVRNLKDQQLINAYHHTVLKNALDFSVPGTGKTYIAYGMFIYLYQLKEVTKLIVIGPLNCFNAWKIECKNIFGNKHHFSIFDCTEHSTDYKTAIYNYHYDIYLFNYESFQNEDRTHFISHELLNNNKCMVVFDEIHRMKNEVGIRAINIINMIKNARSKPKYELALTGTPLPNSYSDLANYLQVLYQDDLRSELPILTPSNLKDADTNRLLASGIQKAMYPLFTRTNKQDLNVPPAQPDDLTTISALPSALEQKLMDLVISKYSKQIFVSFIRQIQVSSNPLLLLKSVSPREIKEIVDDESIVNQLPVKPKITFTDEEKDLIKQVGLSTKMQKTIDLIVKKVKENKSVIVWCLFIGTINLLRTKLNELQIKVISIDGQDKDLQARNTKIDEFKAKKVMVLITNPNTLAESVSLHETCHDAIYLEYGFNLTYLLQSKDRIHRVGLLPDTQTNYYFAITKSLKGIKSIDELIYGRLKMKTMRMNQVINSHELFLVKSNDEKADIETVMYQEDNELNQSKALRN